MSTQHSWPLAPYGVTGRRGDGEGRAMTRVMVLVMTAAAVAGPAVLAQGKPQMPPTSARAVRRGSTSPRPTWGEPGSSTARSLAGRSPRSPAPRKRSRSIRAALPSARFAVPRAPSARSTAWFTSRWTMFRARARRRRRSAPRSCRGFRSTCRMGRAPSHSSRIPRVTRSASIHARGFLTRNPDRLVRSRTPWRG